MPPRAFLKPATVVVTAAVLVSGFAPTALATTETHHARAVVTTQQQDTAERLLATLRQAVTADPATAVARLADARALLARASIEDIDWVEAFKVAFKVLQPFAVAALRYGGPVASGIIEFAGQAVARFPQVGEPLDEYFFKPIAGLVRVWAPRLADIIESIKIGDVPRAEATARIADHLRKVENLSAEAADVLAKGLVANL
ncbi:hypothetical protein GCM10029964_068110 [Kibdelosporangium lantanae]